MQKLTDAEGKALLDAAKRVYAYKQMQAKGYERLARKAQDERAQRLLRDISAGEAEDAEHWAEELRALGAGQKKPGTAFLTDLRIRLMMGILGTRGYFEWALIAEDESVEDLASSGSRSRCWAWKAGRWAAAGACGTSSLAPTTAWSPSSPY
jgi:hypothetical protein